MNIKSLSYDQLRDRYKQFLLEQDYSQNTVNTAYADTFYLWRNGNREQFWSAVEGSDTAAREILIDVLSKHSNGDAKKVVSSYVSQLRRFRRFLAETEENEDEKIEGKQKTEEKPLTEKRLHYRRLRDKSIPTPSTEQVEYYLGEWDALESYHLQEDALDKLFFKLCPNNTDITDILLKVSTLNDFYSTNIYSVYPVAKHILTLDIDARLKEGDVTLVRDIQKIVIGSVERNFYSFATKYCSHHNPLDYPIYDSYVDSVLRYFRERDGFAEFADLKDYRRFKGALIDFRRFYGLEAYNLKQIDKYIWQIGKEYFPKNYGKK